MGDMVCGVWCVLSWFGGLGVEEWGRDRGYRGQNSLKGLVQHYRLSFRRRRLRHVRPLTGGWSSGLG